MTQQIYRKAQLRLAWEGKCPLLLILISAFVLMVLSSPPANGQKIYWTDDRGIHRADLNGKNAENILPTGLSISGRIATDVATGKMYWPDQKTGKIHAASAKIAYTPREELAEMMTSTGLAVDTWLGDWLGTPYHPGAKDIIPVGRLA